MRLDKWLWAARFFKTRRLASDAVKGGKVHLNGQRTKPGKAIAPGAVLTICKNQLEWVVEVQSLSEQRRPAKEAINLYTETKDSIERRQMRKVLLSIDKDLYPKRSKGKPDKRQRRMIHKFKRLS